jgi:hypothetical protein
VVGRCGFGAGYRTVAFDADGGIRIDDDEPGAIGGPISPGAIGADAKGAILVAADPESIDGVPLSQVWKYAPDGARAWTRVLPFDGTGLPNLELTDLAVAADGDAVLAVEPVLDPFRVMRVAGESGEVRWNGEAEGRTRPARLALAQNGRVLVGGIESIDSQGHVAGRVFEFAADGSLCQRREDTGYFRRFEVAATADAWYLAGETAPIDAGSGSDLFVYRFDADGACAGGDAIFADDFEMPSSRS